MAYQIKLLEITDPFAEDFGLQAEEISLDKSYTLVDFLCETYGEEPVYAYINMEPALLTQKINPGDVILVAGETGKQALAIVATIAIMVVAWEVAPIIAGTVGEAWTMGTMVAFTAINMVGSILVNALLAPDIPDNSSSSLDRSKSYTWGGTKNTSEQMIPIPVVLGTFQVMPNLISTYSETTKVNASGIAIRETLYLLFGLSANELDSISYCKINDMDADTFAETDRSVYYTKGIGSQDALTTDTSSSVYALYTGETADPANSGVLFPNIVTEYRPNHAIELPYHKVTATTTAVSVPAEGTDLGINGTLNQSLAAGAVGTVAITTYGGTIPTSGVIRISHTVDEVNTMSNLAAYNTYTVTDDQGEWVDGTINITSRTNEVYNFVAGDTIHFYTAATQTVNVITGYVQDEANGSWDKLNQVKRSTYVEQACTETDLEDIRIQLVFPHGLYDVSNKGGDKYPRAMGFDFKITHGTTAEYLTLPTTDSGKFSTEASKYVVSGKFISSHFVEFRLVDILKDAEVINSFTSTFLNTGKTALVPQAYTIGVRVAFTQVCWNGKCYNHMYDPSAESNEGTEFYDVSLAKVDVLKYNTVLNYPNVSMLGLVLNATPVLNNTLPKIALEVSGKFYYYVSGDSTTAVSSWHVGTTSNPSWLVINMLYNDLWGGKLGGALTSATKDTDFAALVDLATFIEFGNYCDANVSLTDTTTGPRYVFNGVIDTEMKLWDAITLVLKAGNASPRFDGKKITVYWDAANTTKVQLFTSSTIAKGSFTESFLGEDELAECISGNYLDKDANYAKTSIIYLPPGAEPNKRADIELYGITDSVRAMRSLKQKLEKTQSLRRVIHFQTSDASAISCEVGDLIGIQYEFIDFGTGDNAISGRVQSISGYDVTLDKLIPEITSSPKLISRSVNTSTALNTIDVSTITAWNNTGSTTIVTLSAVPTYLTTEDLYLVGNAAEFYKEAIVTGLDIEDDFTATVDAIEYVSSLYDTFYGITINSELYPDIVQADVVVNELKAVHVPGMPIVVSWTHPNFGDADYYMVYKKINTQVLQYLGKTVENKYLDTDFVSGELIYYKVLPVVVYRETPITIPLGWADYSAAVDLTSGLGEYLEAPDYTLSATLTPGTTNKADLTVIIDDPGDWLYKDRREGFLIWTRFSDSLDTAGWLGNDSITLTAPLTTASTTMSVSSITGLPTLAGQVCCLLMVDDCDLVFVYGNTGNVLDITLTSPTYTGRKFAVSKSHASGVRVYNAHKGFLPVKYFSIQEYCTAYALNNQITCSTIYTYDAINNTMAVTSFDTSLLSNVPLIYIDGYTNTLAGVTALTSDSVILTKAMPVSDFTINQAGIDITGQHLGLYEMYWENEGPYKTLKVNDDGKLEGTIQAIPLSAKYAWVAVNRILATSNPDQQPSYDFYISNPKLYVAP